MDLLTSFTVARASVFLLATALISEAVENGYYRAAVVDYMVLTNHSLSPRQNFMVNVHNYEQFIKRAHQESADIIVFPEGALLGSDYTIYITIPDPAQKVVPLADPAYDESLQTLSSYAKNYSINLAVNLHEIVEDPNTKKALKYNTNIVFDRVGAIVARYRKFNLYGEPLNVTRTPEYSIFESDFGVRFGQLICFDILFKEPALTLINEYNITDFIYPSEWFSQLPFLTSVQRHWSWAVGNDVNLLSAGMNRVTRGNGGSGIFRGKNASKNLYTFSEKSGSTLLIGDVPIRGKIGGPSKKPDVRVEVYSGDDKYPLIAQPEVNHFANDDVKLPSDQTSVDIKKRLCHNEICCDFDLSVDYVSPTSSLQYKMVVYDGNVQFGVDPHVNMVQTCGVVLCANTSVSSCGSPGVNGYLPNSNTLIPNVTFTSISITGNFMKADSNILPNILLWPSSTDGFLIDPKQVTFDNKTSILSLKPNRQIITVAIYSRVFSKDEGSSAYALKASVLTVVVTLLASVVTYSCSKGNYF